MNYLRPHPETRPLLLEGGGASLGPPVGEQPWHIAVDPTDERHPILLLDGGLSAPSWETTDARPASICPDCSAHEGEKADKHLHHIAQEDVEAYRDARGRQRTRKGPHHR